MPVQLAHGVERERSAAPLFAVGARVRARNINPAGHTTTSTYDSGGHLLSRTDPGGGTTTYQYDPAGNVVAPLTIRSRVFKEH